MYKEYIDPFHIGVAIFDPDSNSGVACVHGEKPYFIPTPKHLNKDIVWFTNLTNQIYFELQGSKHLKDAYYFGRSINQIIADIGSDDKPDTIKVINLLSVYHSILTFSFIHIGLNTLSKNCFTHELSSIKHNHELISGDVINTSLRHCYNMDVRTTCPEPTPELVIHSTDYLNTLYSQMYPTGLWEKIDLTTEINNNTELTHFIDTIDTHTLIKCENNCVSDILNRLSTNYRHHNLSLTVNPDIHTEPYIWLTNYDYKLVSQFISVKVLEAYRSLSQNYPGMYIPNWTQSQSKSYSFQLYTELLFSSSLRDKHNNYDLSTTGIWKLSYDRYQCITSALQITKTHSVSVVGMGLGALSLKNIHRDDINFNHTLKSMNFDIVRNPIETNTTGSNHDLDENVCFQAINHFENAINEFKGEIT